MNSLFINIQERLSRIRVPRKTRIIILGSSLTTIGVLIGSISLTRHYPTYSPGYHVANFSVGYYEPYLYVINLKPDSPICCDQTPDIWVDIEFQPLSDKEEFDQDTYFDIYWPGQVEKFHSEIEFNIESQKTMVFGEDVYGSRIHGELHYEADQNNVQDSAKSVSFIWRDGIESYGFAERLLRFGLTPNNKNDQFVVKIHQNVNVSTLQENPFADSIEVDPNFGVPVKIYNPTWDRYDYFRISLLYIDESYRVIWQFLLLLSGVIIGIGSGLVSQVLIEGLSGRK